MYSPLVSSTSTRRMLDHLGEFIAALTLWSLPSMAIEGDAFFDHHGAEGGGGCGHFDAPFMAG